MRLISLKEVSAKTNLSATSIADLVRLGRFPKPCRLADIRRTVWLEAEVDEWISARLAERA
jgi:predicted DNA-binding transcriptional regulator AlpA